MPCLALSWQADDSGRLRRFPARQADLDLRPHARHAAYVEMAAVAGDDMLDDGEAEAGAAERAAAARIDPVEAFGEAGQRLGGDAFAPVGGGEPHRVGAVVVEAQR